MNLTVQAERPYLEVDGIKFTVTHTQAKLCKKLLEARGRTVRTWDLAKLLKTADPSRHLLRVHIHRIRKILQPYGWILTDMEGDGYLLYQDLTFDKKAA